MRSVLIILVVLGIVALGYGVTHRDLSGSETARQFEAKRDAETERGRHFDVPAPQSDDDARALLAAQSAVVERALAERDFDTIHEASYALEAGLNRLENSAVESGDDAMLDRLADAQDRLFTVHHASEEYDADIVDAETPELLAQIRALL